jgi:hypothetical protein
MRRPRPVLRVAALLAVPAVLLLSGCVGEPEPEKTPITTVEACAALEDAVTDYYDIAAPGSTVEELRNFALPVVGGFTIPKPTCAFQVRPDPDVIPGDVFTIENFYLDYDEEMTVTLPERLEAAGFTQKDPQFLAWSAARLGRSYSAAVLLFAPEDGSTYGTAAEHFRVLDLSIGQT